MNKSNIFKTAWEIASNGQAKFGGKKSEYFAAALKIAYRQAKAKLIFKLVILVQKKGKQWAAKITGTDPKYGFKREFLTEDYDRETNEKTFYLKDGVYCYSEFFNQTYIVVKNGEVTEIEKSEVISYI